MIYNHILDNATDSKTAKMVEIIEHNDYKCCLLPTDTYGMQGLTNSPIL